MTALHPAKAAGCTRRQIEVFEQIATGQRDYHHPKTVAALASKNLVVFERVVLGRDRFGPIEIQRPYVPLDVHFQWCSWCAENVPEPQP